MTEQAMAMDSDFLETHEVDHGGETWWGIDNNPVIIDFLGDPKNKGLSNVPPKIYYGYNRKTGEYTGEISAPRNPLNIDSFFIPAHATSHQPLKTKKGHAVVWTGEAWAYEPDHRGETWYLGRESVTIETLGDPKLEGLTKTKPPKPLDQIKQEAKAAVLAFTGTIEALLKRDVSQLEIDGWAEKVFEARSIRAVTTFPSSDTTPLLWAEAGEDSEAVKTLAAKVMVKAKAFATVSGLAAKMRHETENAIQAAENAEDVAAVIKAAEAEAHAKLSELGIGLNSETTPPR